MDGENECYLGAIGMVLSSVFLSAYSSPLWLFLTIPMGLAILAHGCYRELKQY